ncbi:NHL repeat-containing protein [Mucilaginibacter sp. BT774]|uniref:NHL repeat-containing protein n=1 Tax=Mucilaginibacter sp. BT774 TaxID=3062276 RepID=UPI0026771833|nr:NHL repeat-containing protein [Mucilaginibacter sp. BT774]MDO3628689.1 NHL repeat-containing protein [Mucilaginibacter sp. BT774]
MIRSSLKLLIIFLCIVFVSGVIGCKQELLSPSHVTDSTIVAGRDTAGLVNGTGKAVKFNHPFGLAVDAGGNLYIADVGNNVIRKMDTTDLVTTFAGIGSVKGSTNGFDSLATFNKPFGVATDAAGNVYVADAGNNLIRMVGTAGMVSTFAGTGIAGSSNVADSVTFNSPLGVAVDGSGNVYVADYENNLIRKVTQAGIVRTLAGSGAKGADDGLDTAATFNLPEAVAVDGTGNVYVADNGNDLIRKITPAGQVSTFAGSGQPGKSDGTGTSASFNSPFGIAVDAAGNVYVADSGNNLIRKITPDGTVTTIAGSGSKGANDGAGNAASFNTPSGIAVDKSGNIYVADENNNLIRKITSSGSVTTISKARHFGSITTVAKPKKIR